MKRWRRRLKKYLSRNLPVPGSEEAKRAWIREQQVLEWKYQQGKSLAAIASALGSTPAAVGSLLHRARGAKGALHSKTTWFLRGAAHAHPRFPRQARERPTRVPTLDELFRFVAASKLPAANRVGFNIELKVGPGHPDPRRTASARA